MPEGLVQIGSEVFSGCDSFSKLVIPASVKEENIGYLDFSGNKPIVIEFRSEDPYKDAKRILGECMWNKNVKIRVPENLKTIYCSMKNWKGFIFED